MAKNLNIQNKLTIIDQQSISMYLQELRTNKECVPLSKAEEKQLFMEYQMSGDQKIKKRIILSNLKWVITMAKQFDFPKARLEDVINEGNIGLIYSFDKYDHNNDNGAKFTTFASYYIRLFINDYLNNTLADVVQPANRFVINKLLKRSEAILNGQGIVEPSDEQLLEVYSEIKRKQDPVLDLSLLNEIRNNGKNFVSANAKVGNSERDEMSLEGTFRSSSDFNADYNIVTEEKHQRVKNCLKAILTDKEQVIVEMFCGLNDDEALTLDQIADRIGLTRERVGQINQTALNKLKKHKKLMFEILGASVQSVHGSEYDTNFEAIDLY